VRSKACWAVGAVVAGQAMVVACASPAGACAATPATGTAGGISQVLGAGGAGAGASAGGLAGSAGLPLTGGVFMPLVGAAVILLIAGWALVHATAPRRPVRPAHLAIAAAIVLAAVTSLGGPVAASPRTAGLLGACAPVSVGTPTTVATGGGTGGNGGGGSVTTLPATATTTPTVSPYGGGTPPPPVDPESPFPVLLPIGATAVIASVARGRRRRTPKETRGLPG